MSTGTSLDPADRELLEAAQNLLARRHVEGRHQVAAALRARSTAVYLGLHVEGSAGRTSICAEGAAIGAAAVAGDLDINTIVAVQFKPAGVFRVISPCGVCRELISDYSPDATVINYEDGTVRKRQIGELIPAKTHRRW